MPISFSKDEKHACIRTLTRVFLNEKLGTLIVCKDIFNGESLTSMSMTEYMLTEMDNKCHVDMKDWYK